MPDCTGSYETFNLPGPNPGRRTCNRQSSYIQRIALFVCFALGVGHAATSITVSPASVTLQAGQSQQFTPTIQGGNAKAIVWSVNNIAGGNAALGTISANGAYVAPTSIATQTQVTVTVTSPSIGKSATATVTIHPPALSITTTSLPSGMVSSLYNASLTATGGTAPYNWSAIAGQLPPAIVLWMSTGALSGTPTTSGAYNMIMQVNDSAGHTATAPLSISIASCASCPTITTTSLPDGTVGVTYAAALAAAGGTPPYSWSILSGGLPTGLTLATTGSISGAPSVGGSYSIRTQVTDSSVPALTSSTTLSMSVAHTVSLSWVPSTTPGVGYNVYRSTTTGGPYTKLTPTALSTVGFTDTTVSSGQTYFYVTTALNSSGESGYSNEAQAVVPAP
jgi:hypothetical protein